MRYFLCLYFWSYAVLTLFWWNFTAKNPMLWGEEVACSFRNVVFLEQHLQADCYATNFSAYVFYWIGSHLMPMTIESLRIWKILFMSSLGPLMSAILLRIQPRIGLWLAALPALLFPLIPTVAMFSTVGVETGLDSLFTFLLFYLALGISWSRESAFRTGVRLILCSLLSVWSVHIYGSALSVICIAWVIVFYRSIFEFQGSRQIHFLAALFVLVITVAASFWPLKYFGPRVLMMYGGGNASLLFNDVWKSIYFNFLDFFVTSSTYEVRGRLPFPAFPWELNGLLLVLFAFAGAAGFLRRRSVGWLILVGFSSAVLTIISGPMPGIRRTFPLLIIMLLLAAVGIYNLHILARACAINMNHSRRASVEGGGGRPRILDSLRFLMLHRSSMFFSILMLFVTIGIFGRTLWRMKEIYSPATPWKFSAIQEKNYNETIETIVDRLTREEVELSLKDYDFNYVLFFDLICRRRSHSCRPLVIDPAEKYFYPEIRGNFILRKGIN